MGNVVAFAERRPDVVEDKGAKTDELEEIGQRVALIVEAIDKQKAEIAQFRAHMNRLRDEMSSLDVSVLRYRERIDSIPHRRLRQQARNLEAMLARCAPDQS
jgi:septal ring factor EnvC (AmiA/AmiB activator)